MHNKCFVWINKGFQTLSSVTFSSTCNGRSYLEREKTFLRAENTILSIIWYQSKTSLHTIPTADVRCSINICWVNMQTNTPEISCNLWVVVNTPLLDSSLSPLLSSPHYSLMNISSQWSILETLRPFQPAHYPNTPKSSFVWSTRHKLRFGAEASMSHSGGRSSRATWSLISDFWEVGLGLSIFPNSSNELSQAVQF